MKRKEVDFALEVHVNEPRPGYVYLAKSIGFLGEAFLKTSLGGDLALEHQGTLFATCVYGGDLLLRVTAYSGVDQKKRPIATSRFVMAPLHSDSQSLMAIFERLSPAKWKHDERRVFKPVQIADAREVKEEISEEHRFFVQNSDEQRILAIFLAVSSRLAKGSLTVLCAKEMSVDMSKAYTTMTVAGMRDWLKSVGQSSGSFAVQDRDLEEVENFLEDSDRGASIDLEQLECLSTVDSGIVVDDIAANFPHGNNGASERPAALSHSEYEASENNRREQMNLHSVHEEGNEVNMESEQANANGEEIVLPDRSRDGAIGYSNRDGKCPEVLEGKVAENSLGREDNLPESEQHATQPRKVRSRSPKIVGSVQFSVDNSLTVTAPDFKLYVETVSDALAESIRNFRIMSITRERYNISKHRLMQILLANQQLYEALGVDRYCDQRMPIFAVWIKFHMKNVLDFSGLREDIEIPFIFKSMRDIDRLRRFGEWAVRTISPDLIVSFREGFEPFSVNIFKGFIDACLMAAVKE